ncbi:MAG: hypothetical protein J3R72DRAFT_496546 [Linnemannia gamsii]|nr:MAG: hypothetical protein J3R72DRAFT_496546 [Linnemannia gamsii]
MNPALSSQPSATIAQPITASSQPTTTSTQDAATSAQPPAACARPQGTGTINSTDATPHSFNIQNQSLIYAPRQRLACPSCFPTATTTQPVAASTQPATSTFQPSAAIAGPQGTRATINTDENVNNQVGAFKTTAAAAQPSTTSSRSNRLAALPTLIPAADVPAALRRIACLSLSRESAIFVCPSCGDFWLELCHMCKKCCSCCHNGTTRARALLERFRSS